MSRLVVFPIPYSIGSNNPYLELLYGGVEEAGQGACRVEPFSVRGVLGARRSGARVVMHIHWETNIYGSRSRLVSLLRMLVRFPALLLARLLDIRIVWTMHNARAHEYPHPQLDALGRALMRALAQAVIVQNEDAARALAAQYPTLCIFHVPHGNYSGVYGPQPDDATRAAERRAHSIAPDDVLLLALGAVRSYKRLPQLAALVVEAAQAAARVRLLIAGKGDAQEFARIREATRGNACVTVEEGFVADARVAPLLAAADYAVIAYDESALTSGALVLALSYGLPVIARAGSTGGLIVDGVNGYVVADDAALAALLERLPSLPQLPRAQVRATVETDTWAAVGKRTLAVYHSLYI